jgi:haloalkane dehalogenase
MDLGEVMKPAYKARARIGFLQLVLILPLWSCSEESSSPTKEQLLAAEIDEVFGQCQESDPRLCSSSHFTAVKGSQIHYRESGDPEGSPILLLHGQPTWSFLYRKIIPRLPGEARVIAPDSIGYGYSDRPDIEYSWEDHIEYMDELITSLGLRDITLVVHDMGSFIGLAYAARHPENVRGIVMMESLLFPIPSFEALSAPPGTPLAEFGEFLTTVKTDRAAAERLIVDENVFLEKLLPQLTLRKLSEAEVDAYRAPFATRESREKLLQIPIGIPVAGEPAANHAIVADYAAYLTSSSVPKLLLYGEPGLLFGPANAPSVAAMLPNTQSESVGGGLHFLQEDQPELIADAISRFFRELPAL